MLKVKAGLQKIKDLEGEIKALVDNKINFSLVEAAAEARMEELKATANQLAETLTSRVHQYESFCQKKNEQVEGIRARAKARVETTEQEKSAAIAMVKLSMQKKWRNKRRRL